MGFFLKDINAQCGLQNIPIQDDTTYNNFIVEGAVLNELGMLGQGVCAVQLKFKHQFIGDVIIELVSPSGQVIELVGPNGSENSTGFTNWDVTFYPCDYTVIPDNGFDEVWNNAQSWGIWNNYNGSYHPSSGCLEDLSGTVNGTWSLNIYDTSPFGTGELVSFTIIFCDDTGINCESCSAPESSVEISSNDLCIDDVFPDILDITIAEPYDTLKYDSTLVYFINDTLFQIANSTFLNSLQPGEYTICGLTYNISDEDNVLPIDSLFTVAEFNSFIDTSAICANMGACVELNIYGRDTIFVSESLCVGDSLDFYGQTILNSGTYFAYIDGAFCDTTYQLEVNFIQVNSNVTAISTSIQCGEDIQLQVELLNFDINDFNLNWYTNTGNIVGSVDTPVINVNSGGWYYVSLTNDNCTTLDSILVTEESDVPDINLTADVLGCDSTYSIVYLNSTSTLIEIEWSSTEVYQDLAGDIKVTQPGLYSVTITGDNGCKNYSSITIIEDKDVPQYTFTVDSLDCLHDSIQIMGQLSGTPASFKWLNIPNPYKFDLSPYVFSAKNYRLEVVGEGGCRDTTVVSVQDFRYEPDFEILGDTITCDNQSVKLKLSPNSNLFQGHWIYPDTSIKNAKSITTSTPGIYQVTYEDKEHCKSTKDYELIIDTNFVNFIVNDVVLQCGVDSIQINFSSDPYIELEWLGPAMFMSDEVMPYIYRTGEYSLTLTGDNGCKSTKTFEVSSEFSSPMITFLSDTLRCTQPQSAVIPSDTLNYEYYWFENGNVYDTSTVKIYSSSGIKYVKVKDKITNCIYDFEFEIQSLVQYPEFNLQAEELNCVTNTAQINVLNYQGTVQNYSWLPSAALISSTDSSAVVSNGGWYYFELTNELGCTTSDSIEVMVNMTGPVISTTDTTITCQNWIIDLSLNSSDQITNYLWTNGIDTLSQIDMLSVDAGGDYYVFATGTNGCISIDTVSVLVDTLSPNLNLISSGNLDCDHDFINLKPLIDEPSSSFNWFKNGMLLSNMDSISVDEPGVYYLNFYDDEYCESIDSIEVSSTRDDVVLENYTADTITCNNLVSHVKLYLSDDYDTIVWQGPKNIDNDLTEFTIDKPGKYIGTITSLMGCISKIQIKIPADTVAPIINGINVPPITCFVPIVMGISDINESNVEYFWYNLEGTYSSIDENPNFNRPGDYILQVTSTNGCSSSMNFSVIANDDIPILEMQTDTLTCSDGKGQLSFMSSSNIEQITWTGPNGYIENTQNIIAIDTGYYKVEVIDEFGCIGIDSLYMGADYTIPNFSINLPLILNCDSIPVVPILNSDIDILKTRWYGPNGYFTQELSPGFLESGIYRVEVAGISDCFSDPLEFEVQYDGKLPEFDLVGNTIYCVPDFAALGAINTADDRSTEWYYNYQPYSLASNINVQEVGLYTLVVTGVNGCQDSLRYLVSIDTITPTIDIVDNNYLQCGNPSTFLDASGSSQGNFLSYQWTTSDGHILEGDTTLTPEISQTGTYTLEIINHISGCKNIDSVMVKNSPQDLAGGIFDITSPSCEEIEDGKINVVDIVKGYRPFEVKFESRPFSYNHLYENLAAKSYYIQIKDSLGCVIDTTIIVEPATFINATLTGDTLIYLGQEANLFADYNLSSGEVMDFEWYPDSLKCHPCDERQVYPFRNTYYSYVVKSVDGCLDSAQLLVRVIQDPRLDFPNIFSPNGDGVNDVIVFPPFPSVEYVYDFKIFSNWGALIFDVQNFDPSVDNIVWDGRFNGAVLNPGVFVYMMKVRLKNGKEIIHTGDITLIR